MNYEAHYNVLIERARHRVLEGYGENHHILPKCMGGADNKSNLVRLTAREHFVAHQLLVKMYPGVGGLISAVRFLTSTRQGNSVNNRMYEWLRIRHAVEMSRINLGKKMTAEQISKAAASHRGKKRSAETKAKISASMIGKRITESQKKILSAAQTKYNNQREAAGILHHNTGKKRSEEWKSNNAKLFKGKTQSPEQIAKRVASRKATLETRKVNP